MPVSSGDIGLTAMSAAYGLGMNEHWLWKTLTSLPSVTAATLAQLGRLADQLLQRYGDGEVSTDIAAFVLGTCRSYPGWSHNDIQPSSVATQFLAELNRQCASHPSGYPASEATIARTGEGPVCILENSADPVSPAIWAQRWRTVFPDAIISMYQYKGHANLFEVVRSVGLSEIPCLAQAKVM